MPSSARSRRRRRSRRRPSRRSRQVFGPPRGNKGGGEGTRSHPQRQRKGKRRGPAACIRAPNATASISSTSGVPPGGGPLRCPTLRHLTVPRHKASRLPRLHVTQEREASRSLDIPSLQAAKRAAYEVTVQLKDAKRAMIQEFRAREDEFWAKEKVYFAYVSPLERILACPAAEGGGVGVAGWPHARPSAG